MRVPQIYSRYFVSTSPAIIHYGMCYTNNDDLVKGVWSASYDEGETIIYDYLSKDWKYVRNMHMINNQERYETYGEFINHLKKKNIYPI